MQLYKEKMGTLEQRSQGKYRCENIWPDSQHNRTVAIFVEKFKIFPNLKNSDLRNPRFSQI